MSKKLWKKKFIPVLGCLFLMLVGGIFICGCQKQETESTEEIKLEEGQSWVCGQIVSINGNEITYYVMEEAQEESTDAKEEREAGEKPEGFEPGEKPEGMPEGFEPGEKPEGMPEGFEPGEMPEGMPEGFESGEMPEGFEPGQMPEGFEPGEMPEGFQEGERPQMPRRGENSFEGEKEAITVEIPVGTQVTTRLGTVTTFSRLAAGDNIKMLVQEEEGEQVILEIWIVD